MITHFTFYWIGLEFNFTCFIGTGWVTVTPKPVIGECFWKRIISFFIFFMVPFSDGDNKFVSISSGMCLLFWLLVDFPLPSSLTLSGYMPYTQKAYSHACSIIQSLEEEDVNEKFLIQLDKFVRLLETPTFVYLRFQVCTFIHFNLFISFLFLWMMITFCPSELYLYCWFTFSDLYSELD